MTSHISVSYTHLDVYKRQLGSRLANLHIYYWLDGVRRPFKEGIQEWKQYLAHIDRNADRFGLLEFVMNDTEEQFLEDAAALHQLLGR